MKIGLWLKTALLFIGSLLLTMKAFAGLKSARDTLIITPSFCYYNQTDHFDSNGKIVKGLPGVRF